ncbi:hypothetical protein E2C01_082989 [Portunus trituberculatus]|uniref:Uncharacterized protein n=1 Tax=Portunus trituberculatus TaxID=210409 RepID=A0A5B7J3B5_PORTR|nr:hypothetical protein [Portunus trituberculatus]
MCIFLRVIAATHLKHQHQQHTSRPQPHSSMQKDKGKYGATSRRGGDSPSHPPPTTHHSTPTTGPE